MSSYIEFDEFKKLIVSPYEVEIAFGGVEWGAFLKSDFGQILEEKLEKEEKKEEKEEQKC